MIVLLILFVVITLVLSFWMAWGWAALCALGILVVLGIVLSAFKKSGKSTTTADADTNTEPASEASAEQTASDSDDPPEELAPAITAYQANQFEQAIQLAAPQLENPDTTVRIFALNLTALAYSGQDQHALALPYWQSLAQLEPIARNQLNLASTLAVCGEYDLAEAAFKQHQRLFTNEKGGDADSAVMFHGQSVANYIAALDMGGRPDLALPYLQQMADFYASLSITDSHFVWTRGLPFFNTFLEQSLKLLRKVKDEAEITTWYGPLYAKVDEEGREAFAQLGVPH